MYIIYINIYTIVYTCIICIYAAPTTARNRKSLFQARSIPEDGGHPCCIECRIEARTVALVAALFFAPLKSTSYSTADPAGRLSAHLSRRGM